MVPNETKLLKMLSNNDVTFFIPPYQRNYEWGEEQCRLFLEDVLKTSDSNIAGKRTEHFFGFITYFSSETVFGQPSKLVLIDGQQRITTTMLFLVALCDLSDNEGMKKYIDSKYLRNENVQGDSEYKIKLKQVEADWETYKRIILHEDITLKEKNSIVYRNYRYFYNKLNNLQLNGYKLDSLIDKGVDKFSVITVELQPDKNEWENPQEIFESMNSLGKPLSLADLVRNYLLLGMSPEMQTEYYHKYWLHIEETLPGNVSNYIRDYMQLNAKSAFKKATENNHKELYSQFKKRFPSKDAISILSKLSECSDLYACLLPGGNTGIPQIDYQINDIKTVGSTTSYSLILGLLYAWKQNKLTDEDLADILSSLRIFILRRRLLKITSAENKVFPQLVGKIDSLIKAKDKKLEMFGILSNLESNMRLPNDIELRQTLENTNFYNFQYCKFYLSMIEETITKSRPNLDDKNLQVEHIMPQTLNDNWKKALGDDAENIHQEYVNNIGNLTLIRHNQELGNKSFSEKKDVYQNKAGLQIAKSEITNNEIWNERTIKKRASYMIEYLCQYVLPIPDTMRKTNNFSIKNSRHLSFIELQIIGEDITFIPDRTITAKVFDDKQVEYEGKKWNLSSLTRELLIRLGNIHPSGSYSGTSYWEYDGMKLSEII